MTGDPAQGTATRVSHADAARSAPRPAVVPDGGLLRGHGALLRRLQRRRHGRPRAARSTSSTTCSGWASTACGCRRSTRRRCATAATTSPTTGDPARVRHDRRVPRAGHQGARAQHARRHRPGDEPHLRRARVVPAVPLRPRRARTATSTCGATPTTKYPDVRIIFVDTETSNWTFDPVRRQFFWHRFFSPPARPQLREPARCTRRCSTSCGSGWTWASTASGSTPSRTCSRRRAQRREPPTTHEFLRELRAMVDREYPGRDHARRGEPVARRRWSTYFGTEEEPECHMCFDFPVMPRIFYSLRDEQAASRSSRARRDPGDPRAAPRGARSCATTTS